MEIEGVSRRLILDTGSNVSVLQPGVSRSDARVTAQKPHGVTGDILDIKGLQTVFFSLNGREYSNTFLVCPLPTEAAGLLGTDFLERVGAVVDFAFATMSLSDIGKVPRSYGVPRAENTALTVFTEGKAESSSQPSQQETRRTEVQPTVGLRPEKDTEQNRTWLVGLRRTLL